MMTILRSIALLSALLTVAPSASAEEKRPASPRGSSSAQLGGSWSGDKYQGGKWVDVDYGRPLKRGRENLFGSGADYGKKLNDDQPVWRAGANQTTRISTEAPLEIGGKTLPPGAYSLFIELKEAGWTLIVSKQPMAKNFDPNEKKATWGAYNYDPKFDLVRVPMTRTKLESSVEQFTVAFLDMKSDGGKLSFSWDKEAASIDLKLGK
jgi:hypothetical protein